MRILTRAVLVTGKETTNHQVVAIPETGSLQIRPNLDRDS